MNIPQSIEWLQAQGRKMTKTKRDSEGWNLLNTEKELLGMINVQTGLIEKINEELVQLRTQHTEDQKILCDFMAKEGFNYPKNAYKGTD